MRAALLLPVLFVGLILAFLATAGLVDVVENPSAGGLWALLIYGGMGAALVLALLRGAQVGQFPRLRMTHLAWISLGCLAVLGFIALGLQALSKF